MRAVELERSKWEAREERLVQQMRNLRNQLGTLGNNREAQKRRESTLKARTRQVQLASKSSTTATCSEKADLVVTTGHVVQVSVPVK